MGTPRTVDKEGVPRSGAGDARRELMQRVRGHLSPRLEQLFTYLCERALRDPGEHVTEEQIGVAVFQRTEGYDTGTDTIVRVQVSQLRRKLEHHFLAEGRHEPLMITLPKGTYTPVFVPREAQAEAATAPPGPAAAVARTVPASSAVAWRVFAAILAVALVALAADDLRLRRGESRLAPHVAHFWGQLTENGRLTTIVLSDASATLVAEMLGETVPLSRYRHTGYPRTITDGLEGDAKTRVMMQTAAIRAFTTWQDAVVAGEVSLLLAKQGAPAAVVSARNLQLDFASADNVVLLGNPRANPWMELFQAGLTFEYRFDDAKRMARFVNRAPQPGEAAEYGVDWEKYGHCAVAYIPKPRGQGSALLLYATDLRSVRACGHFVGDEPSLSDLHRRLGVGLRTRLPHFEVLLRANLAGGVSANYDVLTHRVLTAR
jgi:hypothetical protein